VGGGGEGGNRACKGKVACSPMEVWCVVVGGGGRGGDATGAEGLERLEGGGGGKGRLHAVGPLHGGGACGRCDLQGQQLATRVGYLQHSTARGNPHNVAATGQGTGEPGLPLRAAVYTEEGQGHQETVDAHLHGGVQRSPQLEVDVPVTRPRGKQHDGGTIVPVISRLQQHFLTTGERGGGRGVGGQGRAVGWLEPTGASNAGEQPAPAHSGSCWQSGQRRGRSPACGVRSR
jgi:hypothetical protein